MTNLTPEQWQARADTIRRAAQAFGEAMTAVARKLYDAMQWGLRRFCLVMAEVQIMVHAPATDRSRLRRHLEHCHAPLTRAQYMIDQARLGRNVPMLA